MNSDADITVVLTRKTPKARKVARLFPIRYVRFVTKQKSTDQTGDQNALRVLNNSTLLLHKARPHA